MRRLQVGHMRVLPVGDHDVPAHVDEACCGRQTAVHDVHAMQVLNTVGDVRRQRELEVVVQLVVVVLEVDINFLHQSVLKPSTHLAHRESGSWMFRYVMLRYVMRERLK